MYRVRRHIDVGSFGGYLSFNSVVVNWVFAKRFGRSVLFGKESGAEAGEF